jgi:hypothetical protein
MGWMLSKGWVTQGGMHRTTIDLDLRPFMGIPLPYGVGMLDLEDFGILFHNF